MENSYYVKKDGGFLDKGIKNYRKGEKNYAKEKNFLWSTPVNDASDKCSREKGRNVKGTCKKPD